MIGKTNVTGGAGLNFKVVGNPQPENPKANTIWVNTDVEITGWDFLAAEPANPAEGMVWFSTGTESAVAFNALKKNGIQVYPISAKQYVSGAWVDKKAKIYQNGAWVDWVTYFYKDGNTYDDVTGGYTLNSDATAEADNIKMHITSDGQVAYIITNNKVNISGISTLYLKFNIKVVSSYSRTPEVHFYVSDNKLTTTGTDSVGSGATVVKTYSEGTDTEDTVPLDVSSVTGEKYIFVGLKNTNKYLTTTMNIKEIRGE